MSIQAIERQIIEQDWVILVIFIEIILLFLMKLFNHKLLYGYSIAFFSNGFIKKRSEANSKLFSPFHILLFTFSCINAGLLISSIFFHNKFSFTNFSLCLLGVSVYLILKTGLDIALEKIFKLETKTRYFRFSKLGYLYTISLWLFPCLILNQFNLKNFYFIIGCLIIFTLIRASLIFVNNKKLIFSNFFYFILYICTLEIAPLLVLYKTSIS